MKINKLLLTWLLIYAVGTATLNAQTPNSPFWEETKSKIINPPKGTPTTFADIRTPGTLLVNTSGAMLLLFGNSGLPATPVPQYTYVSNDGGVTWEYQMPFTKYNGYQIFTYDLSSSGKYFITGSFSIGGTDNKPVYFFSKDGKTWDAVNKSDLLDKNYFGIGNHSLIEAKNRKLSDCLNLYSGDIGDYNAVYELHKIYYPDGSIKTVKDDKYDETKRSTNMANFYSYQSATGTYVRGNPVGDYQRIREVYYTCEGTYFASLGGGVSMVSNDDISYTKYTSGLFTSTPAMREKYFPICSALFGIGKVASNEIKLYVKTKGNGWEDTGYYSGVYSQPTNEPVIKYNPKTKRYYIFRNFQFGYTGDNVNASLLQSKLSYDCDCISSEGTSDPASSKPKAHNTCQEYLSPVLIPEVEISEINKAAKIAGFPNASYPFAEIPNGCGAVGDWTYHFIPSSFFGLADFSPACDCHDKCYLTSENKNLCDTQLYDALIEICNSSNASEHINKKGCIEAAKIYQNAVQKNGEEAYQQARALQKKYEAWLKDYKKTIVVQTTQNFPENNKFGTVKTAQGSNLNLRAEPSDKATIINKVPNGKRITILNEDNKTSTVNGEKGKWLKIEYEGVVGWAWGNFIVKE